VIKGYKAYLDEMFADGLSFELNVKSFDDFLRAGGAADYLKIDVWNFTDDVNFSFNGVIVSDEDSEEYSIFFGDAYVFRSALPNACRGARLVSGRWWTDGDNLKQNGFYNIFISSQTAEALGINAGERLQMSFPYTNAAVAELTVAGIYEGEDVGDFVCPAYFIYGIFESVAATDYTDGVYVYYYGEVAEASDIFDAVSALRRGGFKPELFLLEEIDLVNAARYILITISVISFLITSFILNNIVTITVNARQRFIAQLKLLGAKSSLVAALYYSFLLFSFLASFALGSALSVLLKNYYSGIVNTTLDFTVTLNMYPAVLLALFLTGVVILAVRFVLFGRKINKIQPIDCVRSE
jgi:ABC-type antimicrobial peptide transport system permease subunit